jgi:hypothetical protein
VTCSQHVASAPGSRSTGAAVERAGLLPRESGRRSATGAAHGIDPEVLPQVREELGEIAKALDAGAPISPVSAIPVPSRSRRRVFSRRDDQERTADEDEMPF